MTVLQSTYLFVGFVSVVASAGAMTVRLDEQTRLVLAAFAMMVWSYWALQSFSVAVVADNGTVVTESYVGLAALGATAAAVMLLSVAKLTFAGAGAALEDTGVRR